MDLDLQDVLPIFADIQQASSPQEWHLQHIKLVASVARQHTLQDDMCDLGNTTVQLDHCHTTAARAKDIQAIKECMVPPLAPLLRQCIVPLYGGVAQLDDLFLRA